MTCIDFSTPPWGNISGRACSYGANTYTDVTNGVSVIIVDGLMKVTEPPGDRMLFFSKADCDGTTVHPAVTLVIRFIVPRERVTFRLNFDESGLAPAVVNFYLREGDHSDSSFAESRTISWNNNEFVDVTYDSCCYPIQEITIRTDRLENSLDALCWGPSVRRNSPWGALLCLCLIRRFWPWPWPWWPLTRRKS